MLARTAEWPDRTDPTNFSALAAASRVVCVCADDFGMSQGINEAVLELAERSKLSAIGCLVRRDAWPEGARALGNLDTRRIDIGLQLDLSFPESAGGAESALWELVLASYLGFVSSSAIDAEIRCQLDAFEDAMGFAPAFVAGHRHVHQLPGVAEALIVQLKQRYRVAPPWLRSTAAPTGRAFAWSRADAIHALGGKALLRHARRDGFPVSRRLLGVYDMAAPCDYDTALKHWLRISRTGDVLMCHPSVGDSPVVPHGAARRREYLALRASTQLPVCAADGPTLAPLSWQHVGAAR